MSTKETLFFEGEDAGGYIEVDLIESKQSPDNHLFFSDVLVVRYKGSDYTLNWDEFDADYKGEIDGRRVILL